MTVSHDELTRPLGLEAAPRRRRLAGLPFGKLFVGAVASLFLIVGVYFVVAKDPFGGEPYAVAVIERAPPRPPAMPVADAQRPANTPRDVPAAPDRTTAAQMEKESGVKVIRSGGADSPQGIVIHVPQAPEKLAPAPDKRLVERSRHGALPRIATDGARPADVYARPVPSTAARATGRIAIVVGGLGLSQTATTDAVAKLPADVTLAFAPYGPEIDRQVARAREDGHEVMLQVPMEPFDYPDNDPGPHTLVVGAPPAEVMDRLHWVMSRFPGYVGVVNYMGARFTANEQALTPVLRELAGRGLMALDDGSSPRSLLASAASGAKLPAARADSVLDAVPKAAAIDAQLARLEDVAREKGLAIGVANALPVSIERIALWARGLEAKGFVIVPVSNAVARPGRE